MRRGAIGRLVGANIVVDAFGTAVFLAGVGFFTIRSIGATPTHVLNAVAIGIFVGVGLSYLAASLVDTFGPKRVLLWVQALQSVAYFGMLLTRSVTLTVVLCALGAGLSRIAAPVRGTLPPVYLDKDRLLEFKSAIKVYTVTVAIGGSAVAAGLGLLTSPTGLLLIPALNCLSFVAAFVLTTMLPDRRPAVDRARLPLYRPSSEVLFNGLFFAFLIALGSVAESAVVMLAVPKDMPSFVVAVAPAVAVAVALVGQRVLRERSDLVRVHSRRLLLLSLVAAAVSVAIIEVVTYAVDAAAPVVILVVLASALAESSLLVAMYCLWDIQYSIGNDAVRGGIIGAFSVASSIGAALAPALASVLFFSGSGTSLVASIVILTALVITWASRFRVAPSALAGGGEGAREGGEGLTDGEAAAPARNTTACLIPTPPEPSSEPTRAAGRSP